MAHLRHGIKRYRFTLAAAALAVFLIAPWLLRPHVDTYLWQSRWMNLSVLCGGVFFYPIALLAYALLLPVSPPTNSFTPAAPRWWTALVVVLLIIGLIFAFRVFFRYFWQARRSRKVILILVLLFNGCVCGNSTVVFGGLILDKSSCEQFVTRQTGVRIVTFTTRDFEPHSRDFFLVTHDEGDSWQEVDFDPHWPEEFCRNLRGLNDTLLWTWHTPNVLVSFDGGKHWQTTTIRRMLETGTYLDIERVAFQNEQQGYLILNINGPVYQLDEVRLYTFDGGQTWEEAPQE